MSNEEYLNELAKPDPEEIVEDRIRALAAKWIELLGLGHCCIRLWFDPECPADTLACTSTQWEYLTAKITFNLPLCLKFADDEVVLENAVVHELLHVVLAEIVQSQSAKVGSEHEERVASHLALAFQRVQARR
jgi:hypothetical protein